MVQASAILLTSPPSLIGRDGAGGGPDRSLWITVPDAAAFTVDVAVAPPGPEPALVEVPFVVQVPPDTPRDGAVYIASSVDDWQRHAPLTWQPDGTAAGSLAVPRGAWFDYKFTRGDWLTVEKWPGCEEAANRYGLAAAWPVRSERVFAWRDRCEGP